MLTAPSGPMIATSAVGNARLRSARMGLDAMTWSAETLAAHVASGGAVDLLFFLESRA